MKLLLLHTDDVIPERNSENWDLVVDCGRAPLSTYETWSKQLGCKVISLSDFSGGMADQLATRDLLSVGMGAMEDGSAMDWWDVLSVMIATNLREIMLVKRLSRSLPNNCEIFSSRPNPLALALQAITRNKLTIVDYASQSSWGRLRHYGDVLTRLTPSQIFQIVQDKFDPEHKLRRRLSAQGRGVNRPVVLLPSAYINVSRTALAYAALLPEQDFLLVLARRVGYVKSSLRNLRYAMLDAYFPPSDELELSSVIARWEMLKPQLIRQCDEFRLCEAMGVLDKIPRLIPWGLAIRNAWREVLQVENVTACLCADDSNPYTRIPLLLAKKAGLPALACHHGSLDAWMSVKRPHADCYLAKSEMERDYILRQCKAKVEKIVIGGPSGEGTPVYAQRTAGDRPWLVFFTEPYSVGGWRSVEVYRELVPALLAVASECRLKLVFKLHPFHNVKSHRKILKAANLGSGPTAIKILEGAISSELWQNTAFAVTVQSSVAQECRERNIPVFLCRWLSDPYSGFVDQFQKFGVGAVLDSVTDVERIPQLLKSARDEASSQDWATRQIDASTLHGLLMPDKPVLAEASGVNS